MTIYYDYTAGRVKYDDDIEYSNFIQEQKHMINEFIPSTKPFKQTNPKFYRQNKNFNYKAKSQANETNVKETNNFYYSFEKGTENTQQTSTYKKKQGYKKPYKQFQSYNKNQYNKYKSKGDRSYKPVDILIGSKYHKNDIEE